MDKNNILKVFPCVYFIAFLTYSLILFIEKVAFDSHSLIECSHGEGHNHHHKNKNPIQHLNQNPIQHLNQNPIKGEEKKSKIELKSQIENLIENQEKCKHNIYLYFNLL